MRALRGGRIGMIFQEPMTSLNPSLRVGEQIAEGLLAHTGLSRTAAHRHAIELLDRVRIPEPARVAADYPHRLSGGQRQRVVIAAAIACRPALIIADEPTTALDVTIQAEVMDLLAELQREMGCAVLLITHNLGLVAQVADRVMVMYAGRKVEEAPVADLFATPRHPYTQGLLTATPNPAQKAVLF
jgi:peptide/nickel transport system ATP-binding protein